METKTLKETRNYKLVIGNSMSSDKGILCYQIVNVNTDVLEYETTLLPKALNTLEGLQRDLSALSVPSEESSH